MLVYSLYWWQHHSCADNQKKTRLPLVWSRWRVSLITQSQMRVKPVDGKYNLLVEGSKKVHWSSETNMFFRDCWVLCAKKKKTSLCLQYSPFKWLIHTNASVTHNFIFIIWMIWEREMVQNLSLTRHNLKPGEAITPINPIICLTVGKQLCSCEMRVPFKCSSCPISCFCWAAERDNIPNFLLGKVQLWITYCI